MNRYLNCQISLTRAIPAALPVFSLSIFRKAAFGWLSLTVLWWRNLASTLAEDEPLDLPSPSLRTQSDNIRSNKNIHNAVKTIIGDSGNGIPLLLPPGFGFLLSAFCSPAHRAAHPLHPEFTLYFARERRQKERQKTPNRATGLLYISSRPAD